MRKSKWTYEVIIGAVLLVIGLGAWRFIATKDDRAAKTEIQTMIKYAQRQALEIAIIEQASKLSDYRKQLAEIQKPTATVPDIPVLPPVADPKDVEIE